eukprot:TRINITY_DN25910_c0_g1_i1.p1 TRINITY_DN25910_c0_g1~~TRINITY_DN25910_c0_g1_i1.p1  ORF type:complete len:128 (+),score=16.22 TRINITY_DN25910_c0_g1_i1:94-477(+)
MGQDPFKIQLGLGPIQGHVLTSPIKLMLVNPQQFANKEVMTWPGKTFGEDICKLLVSGEMWKAYDIVIVFIPNEITSHFDMLGAFMKNGIFSEVNSTGNICRKKSCCGLRKTNLCEETTEPNNLRTS